MNFDGTTADDRRLRQRILTTVLEVDKAVQGRHVVEFKVERTVNRKGYRHVQEFNKAGPYAGQPKVLVTIIMEVPDDVRPSFKELTADITKIEADGIRAAKEGRLVQARAIAEKAQAEVERLQQELDDPTTTENESEDTA